MKTFATLALAASLGLAASGAQAAFSYCAAVDADAKRAFLTDVTEVTSSEETLLAEFDTLLTSRGITHTTRLCAVGEKRPVVLQSARSLFWTYQDSGLDVSAILP